jgi:hypothetical protein
VVVVVVVDELLLNLVWVDFCCKLRAGRCRESCMNVCKFQLEEYNKDIVPNVCMGVSI